MRKFTHRLGLIVTFAIAFFALALPGLPTRAQTTPLPAEIKIGYQYGDVFTILKSQKILEKRYPGLKVTWYVFPAGPQELEALNVGTIDIAGSLGETPPVFAQAGGNPLVYITVGYSNGAGNYILVPKNSLIKTVADLKGKKVAFNKASSAHLLTIRSLEKFGLKYEDIQPTFLAPPDARAAFAGGQIDAWTIWDPFAQSAIQELGAQVLARGEDIGPVRGYTTGAGKFVKAYPDLTRGIVEELQKATVWGRTNIEAYAQLLAQDTGLDIKVLEASLQTEIPDVLYIDETTIIAQQKVADEFFALGLIPEKINVRDAAWIGGTNPTPAATVSAAPNATAAVTSAPTTAAATAAATSSK
jgi:sulfonate transport system substrate-binding protein